MLNRPAKQESRDHQLTSPSKTLITSFKPRQVLLNCMSTNMKLNKENAEETPISLTPENRLLLLQSISQFLELSGFSKTLKYFQKEADVEKDSWKSCLLNMEEMCYEYLKMRNSSKAVEKAHKEQSTNQKDGTNCSEPAETVGRMKENGRNEGKKTEATIENDSIGVSNKSKKKKNSKSANDSSEQVIEETNTKPSENPGEVILSMSSDPAKKAKDKKKKHKDESEHLNEDLQEKRSEVTAEASEKADIFEKKEKRAKKEKSKDKKKKHKDESEHSNKDVQEKQYEVTAEASEKIDNVVTNEKKESKEESKTKRVDRDAPNPDDSFMGTTDGDKEKKGSKKRKKSSSEENGGHFDDAIDGAKRRKTNNSIESNGTTEPPKSPNGSANGLLESDGVDKSQMQDQAKLCNGSAETRTANAFRRVKEEEVKFADDRLKDNSYWAKDGADSGYGAKAQEVLGQVRGRDFRHEKTKKKRGSYRGGQIDLQSHSIKFNYGDDDE